MELEGRRFVFFGRNIIIVVFLCLGVFSVFVVPPGDQAVLSNVNTCKFNKRLKLWKNCVPVSPSGGGTSFYCLFVIITALKNKKSQTQGCY